jgi:hypothetical protein
MLPNLLSSWLAIFAAFPFLSYDKPAIQGWPQSTWTAQQDQVKGGSWTCHPLFLSEDNFSL